MGAADRAGSPGGGGGEGEAEALLALERILTEPNSGDDSLESFLGGVWGAGCSCALSLSCSCSLRFCALFLAAAMLALCRSDVV